MLEGNSRCISFSDLNFNFASDSFILDLVENSGSIALLNPVASIKTRGNSFAPYLKFAKTSGLL